VSASGVSDGTRSVLSYGTESVRSLEIVGREVEAERMVQLAHFDAVETKAGVVLGFPGAIVALSLRSSGILATVGRWAGVTSGLLALASFWPRKYWRADLRTLRDAYLAAEPVFTSLRLLDSQIVMVEQTHLTLARKVQFLKAAMVLLATAVFLSALSLAIH
jgi:hypothetical protein